MKAFSLFSFIFALFAVPLSHAEERPNIIFIFTDDHCQQALSAYDDSRIKTPHMDRIAGEGMRFNKSSKLTASENLLKSPTRSAKAAMEWKRIVRL